MNTICKILLLALALTAVPLFAQNDAASPELKLDLPLFDLAYQIKAAGILEHGFWDSYTHPGMDLTLNISNSLFSSFHFGMKKLAGLMGIDKVWKKFVYYGGTALGDLLFYQMPLPTGYLWLHESFHVAGFTYAGLPSHLNYAFPNGAYAMPDSGEFASLPDAARTLAGGIESEYLLAEKMQRNNFFYKQNLFNEIFYWIVNVQAWSYAYMPFLSDKMSMTVEGTEQSVSADSLIWAYYLFHSDYNDDSGKETVSMSDLSDSEQAFFKTRVMLSLFNFVSPMMFCIRSIPLGTDTGLYGNFAFRHLYTPFGTDLSLNVYLQKAPFNMAFALHNYLNYDRWFPAIEAELVDYPLHIGKLGLYLSPRILIGMQPKDQIFKTASPEFFGLLGLRVDFNVSKYFLPYFDFSLKTDGWVAGNEFLEKNTNLKVGLSIRF